MLRGASFPAYHRLQNFCMKLLSWPAIAAVSCSAHLNIGEHSKLSAVCDIYPELKLYNFKLISSISSSNQFFVNALILLFLKSNQSNDVLSSTTQRKTSQMENVIRFTMGTRILF
jgi:hypothetical protein